jgi:hypothetical protein
MFCLSLSFVPRLEDNRRNDRSCWLGYQIWTKMFMSWLSPSKHLGFADDTGLL